MAHLEIALPERGRIGIFNRSDHEDCLWSGCIRKVLAKAKSRQPRRKTSGTSGSRTFPVSSGILPAERHGDPQILPERLEGRTASALSQLAGAACELEILTAQYRRARRGGRGPSGKNWHPESAPWDAPADQQWFAWAAVAYRQRAGQADRKFLMSTRCRWKEFMSERCRRRRGRVERVGKELVV